jgi:hypothetical protein
MERGAGVTPKADILPGTQVIVRCGRRSRIGTVRGTRMVNTNLLGYKRVEVEIDGTVKTYLRSAVKPLSMKGAADE